jgi:S-methylmethionine-dependent homocysteine/selenocysteine methylase
MSGPLSEALAQKRTIVLDGAMGTELQQRGLEVGLPLWSANALMARPDFVRQIHADYIAAGADIITTNTFRTTRRTMRRANLPDRSYQLARTAVQLAQQARDESPDRRVLIAGSIAPLEDCYRPDLVPPEPELQSEHEEIASRLAELGVDIFLIETMNTIREAYAAAAAARATGKEFVVSFICNPGGTLLSGETLDDAVHALGELAPACYSINCVSPRHMAKVLSTLRSASALPYAVYANVGLPGGDKHGWEFTHDIDEDAYGGYAQAWRNEGAAIIGGCCGTTPGHIRAVVKNCV